MQRPLILSLSFLSLIALSCGKPTEENVTAVKNGAFKVYVRSQEFLHSGIRKAAHVTEFGIFSITVFRGIRAGRSGWKFKWAFATLVIAVLYAALDEWHQSFVLLRHATPRDVAIDAFGALLAQCFVWGYATRRGPFTAFLRRNAGSAKKQEEMSR